MAVVPVARYKAQTSIEPLEKEQEKELLSRFRCSICLSIAWDAVLTPCNHGFCRDCLLPWLRKQPHCPACRRRVSKLDAVPVETNVFAWELLSKLKIGCPSFKHVGCKWTGVYGDARKHLLECPFALKSCRFCNQTYSSGTLATHEKEQCAKRTVRCKLCAELIPVGKIKLHDESKCPKAKVACPNACGITVLTRGGVEGHLKYHCPLGQQTCPVPGCEAKFLRINQAEHDASAATQHTKLLLAENQRLLKQVEQLKNSNKRKPIIAPPPLQHRKKPALVVGPVPDWMYLSSDDD